MSSKSDETWINHRSQSTDHPKSLLARIIADGEIGTRGDLGRKHMPDDLADNLIRLIDRSGVRGPDGKRFLLDRLRYHLGYRPGAPVASSARLKGHEVTFIETRALDLLHEHRETMGVTIVNPKPKARA